MLEGRRVVFFAALLAVGLTLPSLFGGLVTEDFVQRDFVQHGNYDLTSRVNLFGHDTAWTAAHVAARNRQNQLWGWFPWFTDPAFDASFWRPLSSWTHQLDYRLFPDGAALMHAENLAWYALLVVAVGLLYRRLVEPPWLAGFSTLLYAVDDAHGHAVGWITNRNGLMAAALAVLALHAYDRFRRDGWAIGAPLTVLLLCLALGSGEFALCSGGYFLAHALFLDDAPFRKRLAGSATWVVTFVAWAVLYRKLGFATHGSGIYIDPLLHPAAYAGDFAERAVVLLTGQFGAPPSDLWTQAAPYWQGLLVFFCAMFVWAVVWVLLPLLRADRRARFWTAGLLLSLPPACATFTEDRLLLFAGIGAMPLVASVVSSLVTENAWFSERPRSARALAVAWLVVHAVIAPLLLPYRSLHMYRYHRDLQRADASLFSHVRPKSDDALIVVNGRDYYFIGMMPLLRASRRLPDVTRMIALSGSLDDVEIRRLDERRIWVRPKNGFLARMFDRLYRGRDDPLPRRSVVELTGISITVSEVNEWGEPTAAVFEFAFPLENPFYRWVVWKKDRYETFVPPPIGGSVVVHSS